MPPPWRPAGPPKPRPKPEAPQDSPWWAGGSTPPPPQPQPPDEDERPKQPRWGVVAAITAGALVVGLLVGSFLLDGEPAESQAMIIPEPAQTVTVTATPKPVPGPTVKVTLPVPTVTVTVRAEPEDESGEPDPPPPAPGPEPEPGPGGSFPGSGTFVVGRDIQPGTYRSKPAAGRPMQVCIWRRLKDTSGDRDSTIDGSAARGAVRVTIEASDGAFQAYGCEDWKRVN